jgi:phage-related protein
MATIAEMAVRIGADTSQLDRATRRMERDINNVGTSISTLAEDMGTSTSNMSRQWQNMGQEMRVAAQRNAAALAPFREEQREIQYEFFQMAEGMQEYQGSTQDFMSELTALGNRNRQVNDNMIRNNNMARMSFIQGVATMLARSTQSSKIASNFDRMNNPLYRVNNGLLAITGGLERIANRGQPAALALRMLGPTASMKELLDMQRLITAGLMRFQMVAMGAVVANALMFSALHKAATDSVPGYKQAFEEMGSAVRKAFQPMVDVFGAVMTKVYKFITVLANMVIKFNEAHPTLAKVIQGFLMLIPILTLILSPLAIGIGLFAGIQAAFASIWVLIAPLVTGLGAMMGTVFLVAGAIAGLTGVLIYLWKNNEAFRESVVSAISKLKKFFGVIGGLLTPVVEKLGNAFKTLGNAVMSAVNGDFAPLLEIFSKLIPSIIGILVGGIPGLIISASRFLPAISQGILSNSSNISTTITNVVNLITSFLTNQLPVFINMGVTILTNLITGITQALPLIVGAIVNIVSMIVPIITTMLPVLLHAGIQILQAIINGIITLLPVLLQTVFTLITSLVNLIVANLPMILNAGIQILMAIINGIVQMLPSLISTAVLLISQVANMLIQNLPLIIDAGIKILLSLIDGIVSMLPSLIDSAIQLIDTIVKMLIDNLPKLIDSGVQILMALINGIATVLPLLIDAAIDLIFAIATAIVENLPKILESGKKIINALIDGIIQIALGIGKVIKTNIIDKITEKLEGVDLKQVGKDIIQGLINGLTSKLGDIMSEIGRIAGKIKKGFTGLFNIHSPSRWMRDMVGKNISLGMAVGIESESDNVLDSVSSISNKIKKIPIPNINADIDQTNNTNDTETTRNQPIELVVNLDGYEVARSIFTHIDDMQSSALINQVRYAGGKL